MQITSYYLIKNNFQNKASSVSITVKNNFENSLFKNNIKIFGQDVDFHFPKILLV